MRLGCALLVGALIGAFGLAAGSAWIGPRLFQEPEIAAAPGTAEDGLRCQQKIFEIARGGKLAKRGPTRPVALSEPELNAFLSRHLVEAARIPLGSASVRLVGDGVVELKGQIRLRRALAIPDLLSMRWLEQPVWVHLGARASLEVDAARNQRRYLRLDIERFALGRQQIPRVLARLVVSSAILNQLRWRLPDTVEAITVEPRTIVIRTAS
jgi:hypothetical protein